MPKTLAKTLTYMAVHSPAEFGLFWDGDGTMPWKELYWAMQEDPSTRFVRETHLRELAFLGIEMPFSLEGSVLRLRTGVSVPDYPVVHDPPARLFHCCRRQQYPSVLKHGLSAAGRPFLRLSADREMALRIAKRRDPEPVTIEVLAEQACRGGVVLRSAGPELFLVESLPLEYLMCPPMREEALLKLSGGAKKEKKKPVKPEHAFSPGSFLVGEESLFGVPSQKAGKKSRRGAEWKREARKDRNKRTV